VTDTPAHRITADGLLKALDDAIAPSEWASAPWKRCKAHLPKRDAQGRVRTYYGRCDRVRHHSGDCALERGMDTVWFREAHEVSAP